MGVTSPTHILTPSFLPAETIQEHFSKYGELIEVVRPTAAARSALCWLSFGPGWCQHNPPPLSRSRHLLLPMQIVMKDRVTQKPRGFGFVTFKEQEAADRAFQDEHVLDGRTVRRRAGGSRRGGPPAQQQCTQQPGQKAVQGCRVDLA
jgi:RNA recognition motif-containing protein